MRLLLINNNPAVSRLLRLSVDKAGYEMDEFEDYGLVPLKNYDVVMVDNELYDEEELNGLKEQVHCEYFLYICQRGAVKPDFVNVSLEKPFLPTDFLALLDKIKNVIGSFKGEESKDEPLDEEEKDKDAFEEINTFDDAHPIDAFELEDDALDSSEEEKEEDISNDSELPKSLDDTLPTFDLDNKDEELGFAFEQEGEPKSDEEFESLNFEETTDKEEEMEAEAIPEVFIPEEKASPSILDKDDIDEVKQLLKESDEEEESIEAPAFEFTQEGSKEEDDESEDSGVMEKETLDFEDIPEEMLLKNGDEPEETFSFEELEEKGLEEEEIEEPLLDTQEEIIDDFAEEIEEKIEQENEAKVVPDVFVEKESLCSIDSLDDLDENLLKKAFGEEVDEEVTEEVPTQASQEIEVIRGEIENSIAKSISGFAQSDILREALKGMKINISITFDEKS